MLVQRTTPRGWQVSCGGISDAGSGADVVAQMCSNRVVDRLDPAKASSSWNTGDMDNNTCKQLTAHAHSLVMNPSTVGLLDVPEDRAHSYLDLLIQMLFETLADADPWHELHGMEDVTVDGDRFGYPEAFGDIVAGGIVQDALASFAPVQRDPQTIEEKNKLVTWLSLRRRIITTRADGSMDETPALAQTAALIASGQDVGPTYKQFVAIYKIEDDQYFYVRDLIHG